MVVVAAIMRRPSFVGREAERALLSDALTDAVAGRGRFIMVTGARGIGKTSLTDAVVKVAEDRGVALAIGRAWPGAGAPPWWIWTEVFEALGESLALPRTLASDEARFACLEEIAQRVRARGAKAPILLVLDDLQDVDTSSLLALTLVARTIARLGVLVVATLPDPDPSPPESAVLIAALRREATSIRLEGLGLA